MTKLNHYMCGSALDSSAGSGQKNVMKTRHFVLCFTIAVTGCVGHQTFDDGSDAVREHREDAGPRSDGDDAVGNAASTGSDEADAAAASSTLDVGADVEGTTVVVDVGEELILTLQTIGPGNYEEAVVTGEAVESLGSEYATLQNPGGPTQLFHFRGVAPGQATVSIPHTTRPTFAFQIDVQ
jgi:hypothetical protein